MTQLITIDRATLEQLVEFLEFHSKYWNGQGAHPMTVVTAGRAALANAEPTNSYDLAKRADNGGQP